MNTNKVYLLAALVRDPELRYTPSGTAVCDFTLAGSYPVLRQTNPTSIPFYQRVSVLGKTAEQLAEQHKAGQVLFVEGAIEHRTWDDPNSGQKRSMVQVKALRIEAGTSGEVTQDQAGGYRLQGGLNEVTAIGNLTRDPVVRHLENGDLVADFSIAINDSYKDREGNWQEKTHFLDVTAWRELAEAIKNAHKGDPVLVQGHLKNDSWEDRDGQKRTSTKLETTVLSVLARKNRIEGPAAVAAATRTTKAQNAQGRTSTAVVEKDLDDGLDLPEEDLPF